MKEWKKYVVLFYCVIFGNNVSFCKLDKVCIIMICDLLEFDYFKGSNVVKVMVWDVIEDLKDEYFREIGKEMYEFVY